MRARFHSVWPSASSRRAAAAIASGVMPKCRYSTSSGPEAPKFEEPILPLASPAFIRQHHLRRPEQLLDVPLIQSNVNVVQWTDWFDAFTEKRPPERLTLRFDRAQRAVEAAVQGLGVALESTVMAGAHLAAGRLLPVFGHDRSVRVKAHFAVYPARHARQPPVEAFLSWVQAEAAHSADRLGGSSA